MFALTPGELAMVVFLFALVWGAGLLPRLGAHLGTRLHRQAAAGHDANRAEPTHDTAKNHPPRDGGDI